MSIHHPSVHLVVRTSVRWPILSLDLILKKRNIVFSLYSFMSFDSSLIIHQNLDGLKIGWESSHPTIPVPYYSTFRILNYSQKHIFKENKIFIDPCDQISIAVALSQLAYMDGIPKLLSLVLMALSHDRQYLYNICGAARCGAKMR